MAALLEGLRALGSGRVLDEVLAMVLDSAIEVTGAERGFIMLANREQDARVQAGARPRQGHAVRAHVRDQPEDPRDGCSRPASRASSRICSTATSKQLHTGTVALGIRHVLCTPLRLVRYVERAEQKGDDEVIGVLYLDSRERGALQSAHAQSALETLSAEAALAIENARLYREALDKAKFEQELKVAAAIQQSLLPVGEPRGRASSRPPRRRSPAARSGGDFYDYVDLPTDRFGFIVGDVAGKGSPAALLAAAVLGMFSAEATYQAGAATLMTRLNHGLFRRAIEARFLTSFYGILGADGLLTYSNAGHNAPLLVAASGIRRLETGGVVLGLFEHASYEEETVSAPAGRPDHRVQRRRHRGDEQRERRVHRRSAARVREQAPGSDTAASARRPARRCPRVLRRRHAERRRDRGHGALQRIDRGVE